MIVLLTVIVSYAVIQFFELTSILARISGINTGNFLVSYSIQQTVYMVTRFFTILILPILGLVVDLDTDKSSYKLMCYLSLLSAATLGLLSFLISGSIVLYYEKVISNFVNGKGYIRSFLGAKFKFTNKIEFIDFSNFDKASYKVLVSSSVVYLIYSCGMFISFYFALNFHEHRAFLSQLSGVINMFGAVVLTLFIEPNISRSIDDKSDNARNMVLSLFLARLSSIALFGHILLFSVFSIPLEGLL